MTVQDAQPAYRQSVERTTAPSVHDPVLKRFLSQMPRDVAESFTGIQLAAVKQFLHRDHARNHKVNVRISVPLLFRRYYFVYFVGLEKRSRRRRKRGSRRGGFVRVATRVFLFMLLASALIILLELQ